MVLVNYKSFYFDTFFSTKPDCYRNYLNLSSVEIVVSVVITIVGNSITKLFQNLQRK